MADDVSIFDAVLIGAGHNALAAAVHLCTNGWRVAVLEAAAQPGGAVQTAEVTLPGFRHDLYAMNLSLFAGSAFHTRYADLLAAHGLQFVPVNKPFASAFGASAAHPQGQWCGVEQSLEATLANVARMSPSDAPRWQALSERFDVQMPHLLGLLGQPAPAWANLQWLWKLWRSQGTRGVADLVQLLLSPSRHWLTEQFESPEIQAMLAAWGLHLDFAPDVAGGALFPYLEAMAGQRFGMTLGQGGADTIVNAMTRAIEAKGSVVRTQAKVVAIETDAQGQAQTVVLQSGERLQARRAVIAGVHPRQLYGYGAHAGLLGAVRPSTPAVMKARQLRPGPATMMIHLAMDALPNWRAGSQLGQFAYVHLAPSLAQMAQTYADAMRGYLPAEPVLVVGQPTVFDASRAPAGKHTLWIQVRALPFEVLGDAANQLAPASWDALGQAYADRVIDILERYAPGVRNHILARYVLTPLDLARNNPNLVNGDSLSGSHHSDQFFVFRPAFGLSRWKTPIHKLYHIGASTWPGAGTGAGSGYMLAQSLIGS